MLLVWAVGLLLVSASLLVSSKTSRFAGVPLGLGSAYVGGSLGSTLRPPFSDSAAMMFLGVVILGLALSTLSGLVLAGLAIFVRHDAQRSARSILRRVVVDTFLNPLLLIAGLVVGGLVARFGR